MPMTDAWIAGHAEAMNQFNRLEAEAAAGNDQRPYGSQHFVNPFKPGSDQWDGFEHALHDLTQK